MKGGLGLAFAISLTGVLTASRIATVICAVNISVATMPTDRMPTMRSKSAPAGSSSTPDAAEAGRRGCCGFAQ